MCARYTVYHSANKIAQRFVAALAAPELARTEPRENICPTQQVFVVRSKPAQDGAERSLDLMRWGLVPSWAKDLKIGAKMINARGETLMDKPVFRGLMKRNRCLIPSDGFYEWTTTVGGKKQPIFFHRPDGELLAFAGLWTRWRNPETESAVETCTMITVGPNELLAPIHDRMPAILDREAEAAWLDESVCPADAMALLLPAPDELLEGHPVSRDLTVARRN